MGSAKMEHVMHGNLRDSSRIRQQTGLRALVSRIFHKKGWQGDKTACHKGFAPFLEGDKGDIRVTRIDASFHVCRSGKLKGSLMESVAEHKLDGWIL